MLAWPSVGEIFSGSNLRMSLGLGEIAFMQACIIQTTIPGAVKNTYMRNSGVQLHASSRRLTCEHQSNQSRCSQQDDFNYQFSPATVIYLDSEEYPIILDE